MKPNHFLAIMLHNLSWSNVVGTSPLQQQHVYLLGPYVLDIGVFVDTIPLLLLLFLYIYLLVGKL